MHRTTILLPRDLHRDAEREAVRLGISLSELIRRRLRAIRPRGSEPGNPFFTRKPWNGTGPSDTAANHDSYLYGP